MQMMMSGMSYTANKFQRQCEMTKPYLLRSLVTYGYSGDWSSHQSFIACVYVQPSCNIIPISHTDTVHQAILDIHD